MTQQSVVYVNTSGQGKTYIDGDTLTATLQKYEVLTVGERAYDLTGTIVTSVGTVSVYSASSCSNIPLKLVASMQLTMPFYFPGTSIIKSLAV